MKSRKVAIFGLEFFRRSQFGLSGFRNPVRGGHVYRNATRTTSPPISAQFPAGKLRGNWAGSGFQRTRVSIDMATPNGVPESRRMINCMFLAVLLLGAALASPTATFAAEGG